MPVLYLRQDFRRLFAEHYDKVRFVRQPATLAEYATAFDIPQFENPALYFVKKSEEDSNVIRKFFHDMKYENYKFLEEARNYFGLQGTDEEVIKALHSKREEIDSKAHGKSLVQGLFLPGVFCDVEGTFIRDGRVNKEIKKDLEKYALEKPVNLWTGGNIDRIVRTVGDVRFPVLNKNDYYGAEVEIAIDDMFPEELEKEYGIKARQFFKI